MRKKQIFALFFCLSNLFYVFLHKISILYIVAKLKKDYENQETVCRAINEAP